MSALLDGRLDLAAPWLLLAGPVALLLLFAARRRGRPRVDFSSVRLLAGVPATWRVRLAWVPVALFAAGCVLAAVALARPRLGDDRTVVRSEGVAIELVVDTSGSMWAHDFQDADGNPVDRLTAVKSVVREFVAGGDGLPGRPGDLLGLTVFAGYADAACPLTLDHDLLVETLAATEIVKSRFEDGTSIAQGLAVAVGRLRDSVARSRVVILLTDGVHNDEESDPLEAASAARELGIKVHTVGMGSTGLAPYPEEQADGTTVFRVREVHLDERLLQRIATETGGVYQRAGTTEALRAIYAELDRMERTELEGVTYRRWRELFAFPLGLAAVLWAGAILLEASAFRRLG